MRTYMSRGKKGWERLSIERLVRYLEPQRPECSAAADTRARQCTSLNVPHVKNASTKLILITFILNPLLRFSVPRAVCEQNSKSQFSLNRKKANSGDKFSVDFQHQI